METTVTAAARRTGHERPRPTGRASARLVGAFLIGGALLGAAARLWMRLITSDPAFSWSGTLLIVGIFTIAGTAQGIALAVRRRGWPRWAQTIVRALALFAALLLGGGAGIVMLPALVAGSLALGRHDWPRALRAVLGAVAVLNALALLPALLAELTVARAAIGWVVMVVLYTVIVGAISLTLRPLDDGWRLRRRVLVASSP